MKSSLFGLLLLGGMTTLFSCQEDFLQDEPDFINENSVARGGGDDDSPQNKSDLSLSDLPAAIQDYLKVKFPGFVIEEIQKEDPCSVGLAYEVELDGPNNTPDFYLFFDMSGKFLFRADRVNPQTLPAAVKNAAAAKYPGFSIQPERVEKQAWADGKVRFELRMQPAVNTSGFVRAVFSDAGVFVCDKNGGNGGGNGNSTDDNDGSNNNGGGKDDDDDDDHGGNSGGGKDDDDDDDHGGNSGGGKDDDDDDHGGNSGSGGDDDDDHGNNNNNGGGNNSNDSWEDNDNFLIFNDIPASAQAFIKANFANFAIDEVEKGRLCDGTRTWEVGLEIPGQSGVYVVFNQAGNALFKAARLSVQNAPGAVMAALAQQFPSHSIHNNRLERQVWYGSNAVVLEARLQHKTNSSKMLATFSENGTMLCSRND